MTTEVRGLSIGSVVKSKTGHTYKIADVWIPTTKTRSGVCVMVEDVSSPGHHMRMSMDQFLHGLHTGAIEPEEKEST